jgi:hypothetical protein
VRYATGCPDVLRHESPVPDPCVMRRRAQRKTTPLQSSRRPRLSTSLRILAVRGSCEARHDFRASRRSKHPSPIKVLLEVPIFLSFRQRTGRKRPMNDSYPGWTDAGSCVQGFIRTAQRPPGRGSLASMSRLSCAQPRSRA